MTDANGMSTWVYWRDKSSEFLHNVHTGVGYSRTSTTFTIGIKPDETPMNFGKKSPGYVVLNLKFDSLKLEATKEPGPS